MLTWVGKRPLKQVTAFPAQHVETFDPTGELEKPRTNEAWADWADSYPRGGLLLHGDNKDVLGHLLANGFRGKVSLVYIDPPFDSGADYVRRVALRGDKGTAKIEGEDYTLGEQIQYTDIWANDEYLQFMYERLLLLRELMSEVGSLFLHCDWKRTHLLRSLLDEVFGAELFRNEIIRVKSNPKNFERKAFGNVHDCILYYVKGESSKRPWSVQREAQDSADLMRIFEKIDLQGRRYTTYALHARGERKGETGQPWRGVSPPPGRHWAVVHSELDRLDSEGRIEWSDTNNPRVIVYADEKQGDLVQDIWTMKDPQLEIFPTEKPEALLERIVGACTSPGNLVLDCFVGSGTTVAVAQRLNRRWVGCDINKGAIQTTAKRLQEVIRAQANGTKQGALIGDHRPSQLSFTTWRVNDYDLQIQHNEAVELACEHIGVQRTRTDPFFDGTLGRNLVKIVSFTHPLSPLDLERVKRELEARPEEDRSVTVVCLGMELAAKRWTEDWNRLRRGRNAVNRIEYIELRSDPKHGGFIKHEPATARVKIARKAGKIAVEIEDFISPSIIERLRRQTGITQPKIDDWRAMVDSVMIDDSYDGEVFDVVLSDVPLRRQDLVDGRYELPVPEAESTVAVKITDMLGEEVLVTKAV